MAPLQIREPGEARERTTATLAIGIDLGTTNSVVACLRAGVAQPTALTDTDGRSIIPSAVYVQGGQTYVGHEALTRAASAGTHPLQSFKRLMGRSHAEAARTLPAMAELLDPRAEPSGIPHYVVDGVTHTPISVSAAILSHMRAIASQALGEDVRRAVITVPAYFDDAARLATRQAAELSGLEVLRLINEPTAAALAYGLDSGREGVYAVYDLGGGTFDVSVLMLEGGVFQVLSTAGDTALGGDDVDASIADHLRSIYGLHEVSELELLRTARRMKEALATRERVDEDIAGIMTGLHEDTLEALCTPLLERTRAICTRALEDANIEAGTLSGVVLVGGSTRLKPVRRAVAENFACPVYDDLDPDRVVALGAAIQAHALTHGSDHLLLDVAPLSLGLETMGGIVEKLIYRNTPIPAHARQEFTTYQDGQTGMQIHVVQGEREMVDQCRSLARFELTGIPPMPAGVARVEVRFHIDADGLLSVSAREQATGISQSIEVRPSYGLPIDTIEQMIRESMEHGREDMLRRLLTEAQVEAQRLIEETRSALTRDGHLLETSARMAIDDAIAALEAATSGHQRDAITQSRESLNALLEPFAQARMDAAIHKALAGQRVEDV